MSPDQICIGIDAGASQTRILISEGSKPPLSHQSGPANPENSTFDGVFRSLIAALKQALNSNNLEPGSIKTVCLGMAGLDTQAAFNSASRSLRSLPLSSRQYLGQTLILVNDAYIGLKSGTDADSGVCLIAGTGAHCFGVGIDNTTWSAGNWGYLLGDQHSGFVMGQKIAQHVMKEYDGRQKASIITQYVLKELKLSSVSQFVRWIYAQPNPVVALAPLTRLLNYAMFQSNPHILKIRQEAIDALTASYQAVITHLKLGSTKSLPVVLIGGLFEQTDYFLLPATKALLKITPQAFITHPQQPPVAGALKLATFWNQDVVLPHLSVVIT